VSRFSFDRLDALVQVTTVRAWVYLAVLFTVSAAAVAFAIIYQVPTKVNGEGILLTEKDTLTQVRARATGRLVALRVKLGDEVVPGYEIGRISQDDLKDAIHEADLKLEDLRREDREFTAFEKQERKNKEAAINRVKQAIFRAEEDSYDKMKIAQKMVNSADRLRARKNLTDLDLLDSRAKFYDIRDAVNKGQSRLAELDLDLITAENTRLRAQLERQMKIRQAETKLTLDREKMDRTSRVVSQVRGRVAQVLTARDDLVREGAPVVLLHAPKSERGTDDSGRSYHTIVFVAAGEGKKIEPWNRVEVVPATVKRQEHGFIHGWVVAISELPATKLAMEAALEHSELVDTFLKRYAPGVLLRVQIQLEEDPSPPSVTSRSPRIRHNPFRWSSSSGPEQPLKTGTMCQAAIVVQRRPLISLILPWTKQFLGVD
jgi:HlyD family secretion protein